MIQRLFNARFKTGLILVAVEILSGTSLVAELPAAFQRSENPSVLPEVGRPATERLERFEDATISIGGTVWHMVHSFALQNQYMDGVQARLDHRLNDDFFKKISIYELDTAFFRESLQSLHLERRGTNIIAKRVERNGATTYVEGTKPVRVSVSRSGVNVTSRAARANETERPHFRYEVTVRFPLSRTWTNGHWSAWTEGTPLGKLELSIYPPTDKRELIINDGKPKMDFSSEFHLLPVDFAEFPPPSLEDRFPLLKLLRDRPPQERINALTKLANASDPEAQFLLGFAYEKGKDVPPDVEKAKAFYRASAEQKYPRANFRLAKLYLADNDRVNLAQVPEILTDAINQRDLSSLALFGTLLIEGRAVPKNQRLGMEYLRYAATEGDPTAAEKMAELAFRSSSNEISKESAVKSLTFAAQRGNPNAGYLLGTLYEKGEGVQKNTLEAWKWFTASGRRANPKTESQLQRKAAEGLVRLRNLMTEAEIEAALKFTMSREVFRADQEDLYLSP